MGLFTQALILQIYRILRELSYQLNFYQTRSRICLQGKVCASFIEITMKEKFILSNAY